ncbi:uncharacterized protein GGS22DRAFT_197819 [Annulohypoxylon maeteangense]|uniref:uncharacterized protein n=1 Tax=Annulohypoxylon maeteangense TaxID=1927788 RepID=UPI002007937D|nr:uncharacterized protein GGS22DRAFT_197819 [Annulohypoxylon maeteangense]KAI0887883.1 hypothetical protein GGS22DRAFT_197819 [Annulohypoxylon maeteangense]
MWDFKDLDDSISVISESTVYPNDSSQCSEPDLEQHGFMGYRTDRQTAGAISAQTIVFNIGRIGSITYNNYECKPKGESYCKERGSGQCGTCTCTRCKCVPCPCKSRGPDIYTPGQCVIPSTGTCIGTCGRYPVQPQPAPVEVPGNRKRKGSPINEAAPDREGKMPTTPKKIKTAQPKEQRSPFLPPRSNLMFGAKKAADGQTAVPPNVPVPQAGDGKAGLGKGLGFGTGNFVQPKILVPQAGTMKAGLGKGLGTGMGKFVQPKIPVPQAGNGTVLGRSKSDPGNIFRPGPPAKMPPAKGTLPAPKMPAVGKFGKGPAAKKITAAKKAPKTASTSESSPSEASGSVWSASGSSSSETSSDDAWINAPVW